MIGDKNSFEDVIAAREAVVLALGPFDLTVAKVVLASVTAQALRLECATLGEALEQAGRWHLYLRGALGREFGEEGIGHVQ